MCALNSFIARTRCLRFWLLGAVCLLPLLMLHARFADLFWFGDDWDLMDQISKAGFWPWVCRTFAENWTPLSKMMWGGIAVGTGSHLLAIYALWLTHAVCVVVFALLLEKAGVSWWSNVFASLVLGLSSVHIETLAWTAVWSSVLATLCFLLALKNFLGQTGEDHWPSWKAHGLTLLFIAAGCLCFSRGVLAGAAIAGGCLLCRPFWRAQQIWSRLAAVALFLLPGIIVALVIMNFSYGNHRSMNGEHWISAGVYALWFFALNPFFLLIEVDSWGWLTVCLLLLLKIVVFVAGLRLSRGQLRSLLVILLLYDLGNSLLVGVGRFNTGVETAVSSRYQYSCCICMLPFVAVLFDALMARLRSLLPRYVCGGLVALIILLSSVWVARAWPQKIDSFAENRGCNTRRILFVDKNPPAENAIPGISFMSTARAKELTAQYNLH
jgi:hypothetical protein